MMRGRAHQQERGPDARADLLGDRPASRERVAEVALRDAGTAFSPVNVEMSGWSPASGRSARTTGPSRPRSLRIASICAGVM